MVTGPARNTCVGRGLKSLRALVGCGLACGYLASAAGCSNVAKMQSAYEGGDESQLDKLIEVVSRTDYPYATRKNAAVALGNIGEPRAAPALMSVLQTYDRRTTLKAAAVVALGQIGDPIAVEAIGQLLDRSVADPNADMRMLAMPVLGKLGGPKAAEMLVNALSYYDAVMVRQERAVRRGVFTGEEQRFTRQDSAIARQSNPMSGPTVGSLPQAAPPSLFGTRMPQPAKIQDETPKERQLAHASLVQVGEAAVPVIERHLATRETTVTLRTELQTVVEEIRAGPSPPDDG